MTEIIDTPVDSKIGEKRKAWDLKRGDHVQLGDGRWALLNSTPSEGPHTSGSSRIGASVVINMTRTEWATWRADELVFSRTPEEQLRQVELVFADVKVDATAAAILRREIGVAP